MSALRLPPLPTIRDLVRLYRLRAMKQLSQNFLMDERLTDKIVKMSGDIRDGHVLEVGPGPGGLTRSIIRRRPKRLIVVEKDRRFLPTLELLAEAFESTGGKMDIVVGDILRTNMNDVFPGAEGRTWEDVRPNVHLIGNLPFNVSTYLIICWLRSISERTGPWKLGRARMTLTFQKEVAERLVADISSNQRCRLSVMAQAWTRPILKFIIPGQAFVPKPDVDVGVVTFVPLPKPRTDVPFKTFEKVTRHIFSFRQKYSVKGVGTLFPEFCRDELADVMFKLSDLDPQLRPFQLTVEDVNRLCAAYVYLMEKHPELEKYDYRACKSVLPASQTLDMQVKDCA